MAVHDITNKVTHPSDLWQLQSELVYSSDRDSMSHVPYEVVRMK